MMVYLPSRVQELIAVAENVDILVQDFDLSLECLEIFVLGIHYALLDLTQLRQFLS